MDKTLYLTFDDGPCEPWTSQILDWLKTFGAKASFFVCGKSAEKFPQVIKRIAAEGHTLGNHTYAHAPLLTFLGALKKEIKTTDEIIKNLTGVSARFFRPPWGLAAPWLRGYLKRQGYSLVLWDVMAYDWRQKDPKWMAKRILNRVQPGSVVLLHDGDRGRETSNRADTVKALAIILPELIKQGYNFKALDQARRLPTSTLAAWFA